MTRIDQKWDYAAMGRCAQKLDELYHRSTANKTKMDEAIDTLKAGVDAEVGKAFVAAYAEHVGSIKMFAQALNGESQLLKNNSNAMQNADQEIAAKIRATFRI